MRDRINRSGCMTNAWATARTLLRRINVFATAVLADLHEQLKAFYNDIGRPSVDPELMIRMLLVGYSVALERMDRARVTGPQIAWNKAFTAAGHKRSTHLFNQAPGGPALPGNEAFCIHSRVAG